MSLSRHVLGAFSLSFVVTAAAAGQTPTAAEDGSTEPDRLWRQPIASRNQFPLSLMFIYLAPERAGALPRGMTAVDLQLDYSNIISRQESETELLLLDAEYLRAATVVRHGLPKGMELGASLPFYAYYGGFLDGFVTGFHDTLKLPNFLRGQTENGLVAYELVTPAGPAFSGTEAFTSVGDVSVFFKKTIVERDDDALAVRAELKLPTGDPERLSGSGATDAGIGAAFDHIADRWGLYANANVHFLGQPEKFRVKNFFSFMVGADLRLKPRLAALLQFDHARPFIDGELDVFTEAAQQLALGLRWRFSDRVVYEWRFVEDLSAASPDFTFAFQLGIRWRRAPEEDSP